MADATNTTTFNNVFNEIPTEIPIVTIPPTPSPSMQPEPSRTAAKSSGSTVAVIIAVGVVVMLSIQRGRRRNQSNCPNHHQCKQNTNVVKKSHHDLHLPNGADVACDDTGGASSRGLCVGGGDRGGACEM